MGGMNPGALARCQAGGRLRLPPALPPAVEPALPALVRASDSAPDRLVLSGRNPGSGRSGSCMARLEPPAAFPPPPPLPPSPPDHDCRIVRCLASVPRPEPPMSSCTSGAEMLRAVALLFSDTRWRGSRGPVLDAASGPAGRCTSSGGPAAAPVAIEDSALPPPARGSTPPTPYAARGTVLPKASGTRDSPAPG